MNLYPHLTSVIVFCLVASPMISASCSEEQPAEPEAHVTREDPPIPTAPPAPVVLTEEDIHERLKKDNPKYQNTAEFGKRQGKIISVNLFNMNVENISALKGLELEYLDLTNCPVSDLSPIKGMKLEQTLPGGNLCHRSAAPAGNAVTRFFAWNTRLSPILHLWKVCR